MSPDEEDVKIKGKRFSFTLPLEVITIVFLNGMATFLAFTNPEHIRDAFIIYGVSLGYVFKNGKESS